MAVSRVSRFLINGKELSTRESTPYSFSFKPVMNGAHTLTARAHDDANASAAASVTVQVQDAPPDTFEVVVAVTGNGSVSSTPAGIECPATCTYSFAAGSTVGFTAEPATDWTFVRWEGGCSGTTCSLSEGSSITAIFEPRPDANEGFTIVALPDTQNYLCSRCTSEVREWQPEIFEAQTKWIADNINALDIAFVTHEGDIVECAEEDASRGCNQDGKDEWAAADKAMDILDGKVPYAAAIGDHDYFPEETRNGDTSNYVRYFGASRYQNYDWYGGSSEDELSHYQIFQAGGYTFLHLSLEFEPRDEIIAWAQDVINANPGLPTIITTHSYLQDTPGAEGRSTSLDIEPPIGNTGQQLFKKLIEPNPQVFMVLSGHYQDSERSNGTETSDSGEYHQVSTNKAGSKVYEMLANYQGYNNGGDGWLRIIQFKPGGGANGLDRIAVRTYSPWRDEYQPGSASNFSFDLDFAKRFDLEP